MADRRKGLRLILNTENVSFRVSGNPEPKVRDMRTREQKVDSETKLPMWSTELTAQTANGAQVINVTTLGNAQPAVSIGELVDPVELEALPWTNTDTNGQVRSGVAFKAVELRALVAAGV